MRGIIKILPLIYVSTGIRIHLCFQSIDQEFQVTDDEFQSFFVHNSVYTVGIIAQKKRGATPLLSNFFCLWILIEPIWRSVLHDTSKTQKFYLDRVLQGHMLEDHNEN